MFNMCMKISAAKNILNEQITKGKQLPFLLLTVWVGTETHTVVVSDVDVRLWIRTETGRGETSDVMTTNLLFN